MDDTDSAVGRTFTVKGESRRKFIRNILTGEYLSGFSQKDEEVALKQATFEAMKRAMVQFAIQFPVSGEINRISQLDPEVMGLDRGVFHGLTSGTQVVVWYDDGGAGIPIAYANASPGEKQSSIKVYKWNNVNSRYKAFIESIQQPGFLAGGEKLYATSLALPYPKEWEKF